MVVLKSSEIMDKLLLIADGDQNLVDMAITASADGSGSADLKNVVEYILVHGSNWPAYRTGVGEQNTVDLPASERMLRRKEAAKYIEDTYNIPCSPKTLAKLACVSSDGPQFRLVGRFPLYPKSALDAWAQAKIGPLVRSTSEA